METEGQVSHRGKSTSISTSSLLVISDALVPPVHEPLPKGFSTFGQIVVLARLSSLEVVLFARGVPLPAFVDLLPRPFGGPPDLSANDPVVRLAVEAPVPDGGIERDGFAVEDHSPVGRGQRRHNLVAAAAAAKV